MNNRCNNLKILQDLNLPNINFLPTMDLHENKSLILFYLFSKVYPKSNKNLIYDKKNFLMQVNKK